MWHKNVGSDGDGITGNLNEPSWIISVDASLAPNKTRNIAELEMWANAQRDGRPAEYRWCPLFNAAKFG